MAIPLYAGAAMVIFGRGRINAIEQRFRDGTTNS